MRRIQRVLPWNRVETAYGAGLDLGDGRMLAPEDVLDGHSARLLASRGAGVRQTVPVHVDGGLSAAITVMAPKLAPLTDLAEEVAVAVTAVAPAPDFRRHLSEALERTHRQYRVQEALGTRPNQPGTSGGHARAWLALAVAVCVAAVVGLIALRTVRRGRPS